MAPISTAEMIIYCILLFVRDALHSNVGDVAQEVSAVIW